MQFNIRHQVEFSDLQKVRVILEDTSMFYDYEVDVALELLEDNLENGEKSEYKFLIIEDSNKNFLGYSCYGEIPCTEGSYDLFWIAVSTEFQRNGIGAKLLSETEKMISKNKGRKIYIETSNRPLYLKTRSFYLKYGYEQEALIKDFYNIGDDKIIYVKTL